MLYKNFDIVFQEVPGEVSLLFTIPGCSLKCPGCHSEELHNLNHANKLDEHHFIELLEKYKDEISCICFLGGEWFEKELINLLKVAKKHELKTCLYTGLSKIPNEIKNHLDFLKTGRWVSKLGGLNSPTSNQRFIRLKDNTILNHLFQN